MRLFGHRASIVRMPRLPRQVIVLALSINIAALGLIIPYLVAEEKLMFRVIYNLVLNAMRAMKNQSGKRHILIGGKSDAEKCEIFITDTGPGLPGGQAGALLLPHIGLRPDGTGLGLKIVALLLSWHGGRIDVEHTNERGTRFKITLPHENPGAPRDDELAEAQA